MRSAFRRRRRFRHIAQPLAGRRTWVAAVLNRGVDEFSFADGVRRACLHHARFKTKAVIPAAFRLEAKRPAPRPWLEQRGARSSRGGPVLSFPRSAAIILGEGNMTDATNGTKGASSYYGDYANQMLAAGIDVRDKSTVRAQIEWMRKYGHAHDGYSSDTWHGCGPPRQFWVNRHE